MAKVHAPRKAVGWAIRDDGMLYPAYDSVLRQQNYRPYHGDVNASLEQRLRYLQGFSEGTAAKEAAEKGVFNIATAEKEDLIDFMLDEYGHQLDSRKTIEKMRTEAMMFIQLKLAEETGVGVPEAAAVPGIVDAEEPAAAPEKPARRKASAGIAA